MGTHLVDLCNRTMMIGLVASYVVLVAIGASHVEPEYLKHVDWNVALAIAPFMIISFGFHNLIPSLTTYLNYDVKRLKKSIILGSLLPLAIYLVWEGLILGLVPIKGPGGFIEVIENEGIVTEVLKNAVGNSKEMNVWILLSAQVFALFAILTSFLGNSLSFVDFLADGFKVQKSHFNKLWLCLLVIAPPFAMALIYPRIFLTALNYAGAYGAVILFGILPACMVWSKRYSEGGNASTIVPGGKMVLALVVIFAFAVMGLHLFEAL
jgi:tyrosine-specific transport protein